MKTRRETPIGFDTAKFNAEIKRCRDSQVAAFESLGRTIYKKTYGLELSASAEFWRLALGKTTIDECIKEVQNSICDSKYNPTNADWQRIMKQISEVAKRSNPMTNDKWQKAKQDRKNDFTLIQRWVADPNHPDPVRASLCFYTWEAMAKMVYWFDWKISLPKDRIGAESARLKKQCQRLNLRQSDLRLIKGVEFRPDGTCIFEPFKQHLSLG